MQDVDAYTVKEIARRLNISLSTAYMMVREGILPSIYIGCSDRNVRIPKADFEHWLKKRRAAARLESRSASGNR